MVIEGRLSIELHPARGQVRIRSSRPLRAVDIFTGKTPQAVLSQLPLLFSVCGAAQAQAAVRAFRQALGDGDMAHGDTARTLLVRMETAREHLWRIFIDWPARLGEAADTRGAAPLRVLLPELRQALFGSADAFCPRARPSVDAGALETRIEGLESLLSRRVFACAPQRWRQIGDGRALAAWAEEARTPAARLLRQVMAEGWQGVGAVETAFLPRLPAPALNRRLAAGDAERFIAAPQWQARARETTPLARQGDSALIRSLRDEYGNGLLARLTARLVELAAMPQAMRALAGRLNGATLRDDGGDELPAGIGIGQVEAARGRLVHRVEMAGEVVARYQILAPTEWNFHPDGVLARALAALPATDEDGLRRQVALLIDAMDPCVGYDLRVRY